MIATSGPGATNLITTIGSCYFDSIPLLCITGQVNTYEFNYNKISRQIGFQETDIVEIVKPITKYAVMVNKIEDLRYERKSGGRKTLDTAGKRPDVLRLFQKT